MNCAVPGKCPTFKATILWPSIYSYAFLIKRNGHFGQHLFYIHLARSWCLGLLPESGTPSPKQPLSRGCLPESRTLCSRYWKTRCAAKASVQPKLSLRAVARNTCFCRQANASWRPLKAMAPACNQLLDPFGAVKGSPQQPQALDDVQQVNFKDISAGFTLPQWGRTMQWRQHTGALPNRSWRAWLFVPSRTSCSPLHSTRTATR